MWSFPLWSLLPPFPSLELWILFFFFFFDYYRHISSYIFCDVCCILCRTHVYIESLPRRVIWNESSYANGSRLMLCSHHTTSEKRISFLWRWMKTPNQKLKKKKNEFTWLIFLLYRIDEESRDIFKCRRLTLFFLNIYMKCFT